MTDTSKEAVKRYRPDWVECYMNQEDGGPWVPSSDYYALDMRCADLEAEKRRILAEAETAEGLLKTAYVRAERAEAERDAIAAAMVEAAGQLAEKYWGAGHHADQIRALIPADALTAQAEEIRALREALITIRDKRGQCNRAADCQAVARAALAGKWEP